MYTSRRKGRELAVQGLYEMDVRHVPAEEMTHFWYQAAADLEAAIPEDAAAAQAEELRRRNREAVEFAKPLLQGVAAHQAEIDELIEAATENWRSDRLSVVDRCVLRLATFEMLHRPEIPTNITLDEAIEIARRFSTGESARFVNGVLDQIASRIGAKSTPSPARGEQP